MSLKEATAYSGDPRCVLKIAATPSPRAVTLADGTALAAGAPIVEAHFWNEHLPAYTGDKHAPGLAMLRRSLRELARHLQAEPALDGARAVYGEMGFLPEARLPQLRRIADGLGFELVPGERPGWNPLRRAFWRNAVSWWFLLRFNPGGARRTRFGRIRRCEAWMSRERLLARYGN